MVGFLHLRPQPVRTIGDHQLRDTQPLHPSGMPEVRTQTERHLLRQSQLSNQPRHIELTIGHCDGWNFGHGFSPL